MTRIGVPTDAPTRCPGARLLADSRPAGHAAVGWFPVLSLVAVVRLLAVAAANGAAARGEWWADLAFFGGLRYRFRPSR